MLRWGAAAALAAMLTVANAQQRVQVPSLEEQAGRPLQLVGHRFAVDTAAPRPAIVLLHGCGGPDDNQGWLDVRMREYAALLNAEGWHALVLDSFAARGVRELCTQPASERAVKQAHRRLDALGALRWLAAQREVDASRLALLGWSNGGSTVPAATNRKVAVAA